MQEREPHAAPIKNWKQLVVIVVAAFLVPIIAIVLISQYITGSPKHASDDDNAVIERIKPVGEVVLAAPTAPKGQLTGEQVFGQVCKNCHEAGLAGAPKAGDKSAWSGIIAQGLSTTVDHAVKGIRAMPPKGGNPDFEPIEVERAVVYMANMAGANWKEPPPAPAGGKAAERSGEQVVQAACGKCHLTGAGGAPKIGDRAAWTPRVAKGLATVTQSALKGHGGMPARGGMADLSDAEVKSAIEYMMNAGVGKTAEPAAAATQPSAGGQPAAAGQTAAGAGTPPSAPASPALAAGKPDGKSVYDTTCMACHATGAAGAPKYGDKAAWSPRLKGGVDALYPSALKGKGAMPPKGGNAALSDADVKAAVDYMAAAAK